MKLFIILLILASIQLIKSETPNEKLLVRNKRTARNVFKQPELNGFTLKARSLPEEVTVNNVENALEPITGDQKERQSQNEFFLKRLLEDIVVIKKTVTKIVYQNPQWIVIQRRLDGSEDFDRTWNEYKEGFGNPQKEFFIGLQTLHEMTSTLDPFELLIIMEDFDSRTRHAKYNSFRVGSEDEKYAIKELGDYSGDAGDSMFYHRSRKFSTKDRDNDNNETINCAEVYKGGWWFDNCYSSFLNGPYYEGARSCRGGINWFHWHNYMYSLKFVEMMIRKAPQEG